MQEKTADIHRVHNKKKCSQNREVKFRNEVDISERLTSVYQTFHIDAHT